jgi:hypothetical protein
MQERDTGINRNPMVKIYVLRIQFFGRKEVQKKSGDTWWTKAVLKK